VSKDLKEVSGHMGAPRYIEQILTDLKREVESNTISRDFNTPLSTMDRSSRQKISKKSQALNNTLDQINITNI